MKVKLPIFFYNENTRTKSECGLDCKLEENDIRMITFYRIDGICRYKNTKYTMIFSNGCEFISQLNITSVELLLDNQQNSTTDNKGKISRTKSLLHRISSFLLGAK